MGWYGLAMGFGPVIAPTISGILMDLFSWRMVFVVSIALMIASFICALFVFDNFLPTATLKFDTVSFVLSALAFGGLTLGGREYYKLWNFRSIFLCSAADWYYYSCYIYKIAVITFFAFA